jgi:hypothetical protein
VLVVDFPSDFTCGRSKCTRAIYVRLSEKKSFIFL